MNHFHIKHMPPAHFVTAQSWDLVPPWAEPCAVYHGRRATHDLYTRDSLTDWLPARVVVKSAKTLMIRLKTKAEQAARQSILDKEPHIEVTLQVLLETGKTLLRRHRPAQAAFRFDKHRIGPLLRRLGRLGIEGRIAALLFLAQWRSNRAKLSYEDKRLHHYHRKGVALRRLTRLLPHSSLNWGWGKEIIDPFCDEDDYPVAPDILYVDLPSGQVSFHSDRRWRGPNYGGEWDRSRASEIRILTNCDRVLSTSQDQDQ